MKKNFPAKLLSLVLLSIALFTVYSCEEDDEDSPSSSCSASSYNSSGASYSCQSGYVAVGNTKCCPSNATYYCPSKGKCYTSCEAASDAGCSDIVSSTPGGSGGSSGGGGSTSGVCSGAYTPISDAQLNAYCGAAYAYRCLDGKSLTDPGVQSVCNSYRLIKTSSAPDCPYCK